MDIQLYFPVHHPFQVQAPPLQRLPIHMRIGLDQLVDWRDINMAIHDDDSDIDSVRTILLEKVFNHNRKVIDNRRLRDGRLQSLM